MITVYGAHGFPAFAKALVRDFRAMWALEELEVPYEIHWLDMSKGEHKRPPNSQINCFGKIPSLESGALRLFESGAIVLYLYENVGKAPQDAHARAELNQWCFAALSTIESVFFEITRWNFVWKDKPGRDWRYPELVSMARERLAELEAGMAGKPHLLGEFGPADILMTTALDFGRSDETVFEASPVIRSYLERCKARPGYQRALAKHGLGPDAKAA
jgi:glutathione S-transferase